MSKPTYTSGNPPAIDVDFLDPVVTLAWDLLGNGTDAPTTRQEVVDNLGESGFSFTASADNVTTLAVAGHSSTQANPVFRLFPYSGASFSISYGPGNYAFLDNGFYFQSNAGAQLLTGNGWAMNSGSLSQPALVLAAKGDTATADILDLYQDHTYTGDKLAFTVDINGNIWTRPSAIIFSSTPGATGPNPYGGLSFSATGRSISAFCGDDAEVAFGVIGNSATQSADLFRVTQSSGGPDMFKIASDGTMSMGTYTAGAPSATGYITINDAAGNPRKVLVG